MRVTTVCTILASLSMASAWAPSSNAFAPRGSRTGLRMALDYNDPVVAEEFAKVQPMTYEEVEEELLQTGIRAPATMNEMEVKLMLVEIRMRKSGQMAGSKKKTRPTKFSSKFEEALWTKPAFEEYYIGLKAKGDHNILNVVTEYVNDPAMAEQRYGKDYKATIRMVQAALTAPPPVKSTTLKFSGFPANMGEMGCKMTLEALGTIVDFECAESEDLPILTGKVTFEDIETAKKAVEQYDGMDMGMGTKLELLSV